MKRLATLALLLSLGACMPTDPTMEGTAGGSAATFTIQTDAGLAICVTYYGGSGSSVDCVWPDR